MIWKVQLLGGFEARFGDTVIRDVPATMLRLLARLLLEPDVAHSRKELAAWLWPADRPRKGRGVASPETLRLNRLRRLSFDLIGIFERFGLPPGSVLLARRATLQIRALTFDTDVSAFKRSLRDGDLDSARAALARGLLPGVRDAWLDVQRERLTALLQAATLKGPVAGGPDAGVPTRIVLPYPNLFFGREAEVERLGEMLGSHRLNVITGLAGCGKSRLAVRVAESLRCFDPVAFVPLHGCDDPDQLADRVCSALGLPTDDKPALDRLATRIAGQTALLILDDFDLLVGTGEAALERLLLRLVDSHVLLTSRRTLQRPGAPTLRLEPLPLAQPGDSVTEALRSPAVALFADRAASGGFRLNRRNVAAVIHACHLLDGLPLAIEIAASRARTMPPEAIVSGMRQGLARLAVRVRKARGDGRERSLEAALQWSWGLLSRRERTGLVDLATLRGQWTLTHARAMTGTARVEPLLASLQRSSLIFDAPLAGAEARMGMLQTVREFALEQTTDARQRALRKRHREYFAALCDAAQSRREPPTRADLPDFLAAMASASAEGQPEAAARIACWIGEHLTTRGAAPEAIEQITRTLDSLAPESRHFAALRGIVARLLFNAGRTAQAQAVAEETLRLTPADAGARAEALYVLTHVHWLSKRDHAAAVPRIHEGLQLAVLARARDTEARLNLLLGAVTLMQGLDVAAATRCFEASARIATELGDSRAALQAVPGHVACLMAQGQYDAALAMAAQAEARAATQGLVTVQLQLMNRQGVCQAMLNRNEQAVATCRRQVRVARSNGMAYHLAFGLWNQCLPLARLSELETAARLMGFSQHFWRSQFGGLDEDDRREVGRVRSRVSGKLGAARCRLLFEQGQRMNLAEAALLGST